MAVSATPTLHGNIKIVGKAHGALNTIVTFYDYPDDFEFKQFVSQEQLEAYATENGLTITGELNENNSGS